MRGSLIGGGAKRSRRSRPTNRPRRSRSRSTCFAARGLPSVNSPARWVGR